MALGPDTRAALDRSLAALEGQQQRPAEAQPDTARPLRWDGGSWTRRPLRPGETDPPVDLLGNELEPRDVTAGWDVVHRTHIDRDGFSRAGVVFDTDGERIDDETGEMTGPRLHVAGLVLSDRGGVRDVVHLVLAWPDDVESASPPRRAHIAEVVTACARLASRKQHAHRRPWLLGVASRLEGVDR